MAIAGEYHQVTDRLIFWQAYDPAVKCDLSSAAYLSEQGPILIDPIGLDRKQWPSSWQTQGPRAIVLTNANHERAAEEFRRVFSIPIWASEAAGPELTFPVDHRLSGATELLGLQVLPIPGAVAGETAFLAPEGILFLGDAVINLEETGLALLPKKYCLDARQNRLSLKTLLDYEFSIITFAHGLPLRIRAKERLRALLEEV